MRTRFTQAARRHKIGRAHVLYVMNTAASVRVTTLRGDSARLWVGRDDRGVELEVLAVETIDTTSGDPILLVVHVMPKYR